MNRIRLPELDWKAMDQQLNLASTLCCEILGVIQIMVFNFLGDYDAGRSGRDVPPSRFWDIPVTGKVTLEFIFDTDVLAFLFPISVTPKTIKIL
jgi:hypothetical protein